MVMGIVICLIILSVGIGVLVSFHVCIVGRAFRGYSNHGSGEGTQEQNSATTKIMSNGENIDDLKDLPCFDSEEPEKGCSLVDCAVCLENFKAGDACRLLPNCSHSFHVQCIDSWILKTPICPICRTRVQSRVMVPTVLREEESAISDHVEIVMA